MTLKDVKPGLSAPEHQAQEDRHLALRSRGHRLCGRPTARCTPAQVELMKQKPDGSRRLVIAYMSIGEAETYRPYWNKAWRKEPPEWLGKENRQWRGNFGVKFWEPGWQAIVFDYAERMVAAGFTALSRQGRRVRGPGPSRRDGRVRRGHRGARQGEEPGLPGDLAERRRPAAAEDVPADAIDAFARKRICSSARTTTANPTSRTASRKHRAAPRPLPAQQAGVRGRYPGAAAAGEGACRHRRARLIGHTAGRADLEKI